MKAFNNYDSAKTNAKRSARAQLPLGTYICKILKVEFIAGNGKSGDRINLFFDVAEGEAKDFFNKDYYAQATEDRKWRGRTTIWCPKDDGSESDNWTKNAFAKWTVSLEESNEGYSWDWDESKWKGLLIGITFRKCGKVIEGKAVDFNEVAFPVNVEYAREHPEAVGKFKAYKGYDAASDGFTQTDNSFLEVPFDATTEELPF